jgi:hypothetical protein
VIESLLVQLSAWAEGPVSQSPGVGRQLPRHHPIPPGARRARRTSIVNSTATLFKHDDGRYAVSPGTDSSVFTHNEPAWHRAGPVDVSALTAPAIEANREKAPNEASTDQLIELTAHLERMRARAIVESVGKVAGQNDPDTLNPVRSGWSSACEEIALRLKTEAWGMLPNGGWGPTGAANDDDRPSPEFPELLRRVLTAPHFVERGTQSAPPAGSKQQSLITELGKIIHNMVVAQQAAWIAWQHGDGAEAAMTWIHNGLAGPGQIPDEDAPYAKEAQAWYDANCADPMPKCFCGRPSNIGWMSHGFCCDPHYQKGKAAQVKANEGSQ